MKILLLTQFFSNTKGGGEYVFSLMSRLLADSGNDVWVITNRIKDEVYASHKNVRIIFVPPLLEYKGGHPPGFKDNITYSLCAFTKAISIIKNEKIDIIESNNFAPALAGTMISILTSIPHITVIHDVFSLHKDFWKNWGRQENVSRLNVLLVPIFEKIIFRLKCVAIHTVSETSKEDLIKFGAKKPIYVIHNAIENYEPEISESIPFQFIYIGRLVFYKNLEVVIKSIKIVRQSYPKVTLIIIGGGPHKKILEKLVTDLNLQDNIKFKGHVSDAEKKQLLSSSQALVFPSLCEGFGIVVLEAFVCKKPVLVPNVRPLSDIVDDQTTGFVIPAHDENEWAKALIRIIEDPEKAHKMGFMGKEVFEKKYNVQIMLDKLIKMYNDFVKG
jgi:glycosyltransferase involved in cell wall biosynthesis